MKKNIEINEKYYLANLTDDMRMKLFVIQHKLSDRNLELSATDVLELCIDDLFERLTK